LLAEKEQVENLLELSRKIYDQGIESKFSRLEAVITDSAYKDEKMLIFTEHRDTLIFLVRRMKGLGYAGQIAHIHGGMHYTEREKQVGFFRRPRSESGARFLVATDAAGEGINLQFCWIMINYDIPWNPARLEQRMGRIHRYGQTHDPVIILNLVAVSTREGRVLKTLLDKLEKIREELRSDKVFDVIGRIFEDVSIKQYMEQAIDEEGAADAIGHLEGYLTKEQVAALDEREKRMYGDGGDVVRSLPRLNDDMTHEAYLRLLPGYVRQFIRKAAPLTKIGIDGDMDKKFTFSPLSSGSLLPEIFDISFSVHKPAPGDDVTWLHPGEPRFEDFRSLVNSNLGQMALKGAVFVDSAAEKPYLFHVALITVIRDPDPFLHEEILECRLAGLKQYEDGDISSSSVEHLLLLRGGQGLPSDAQRLAMAAGECKASARRWLADEIACAMAEAHRKRVRDALPEREAFIRKGFGYQEADLAGARSKLSKKARAGDIRAKKELTRIKERQKSLACERSQAISVLHAESEMIRAEPVRFIAHALVVPSYHPEDQKQQNIEVERVAMRVARAFEEAAGAVVTDVHTPKRARAVGLPDHPGFDILSVHSEGDKRGIEVKGRAGVGSVEVTDNEWAKACNLRERYWLYVVYDCATPNPRLLRVQDPFAKLLVRARHGVSVSQGEIFRAAEN